MNKAAVIRLTQLSEQYALAYIERKDAPEGVSGARELITLALSIKAEQTPCNWLPDHSGKALKELDVPDRALDQDEDRDW